MTEDPRERALVEELVVPRTALEKIWGARFRATIEREVPGTLKDDALPVIEQRIKDSFALNEEGFASGARLVTSTPDRVEWQVMRRGQRTTGTTAEASTGTAGRVVLHRGPSSTRVEMIVALGSPWALAVMPASALIVFGLGRQLLYLVVPLIVGVVAQWLVRGMNANAARARLRSAVRSLPTICDAVADASRSGGR